ncbi:effector-associated domain EAD1-containing protein [Dactylosporangium sp. NPDC049742]|uniref:effector-associated domain EAD1-containing protein n=1 Tax=Dactylosporangium sp. NPDC049742 TaxID=3154737 RepID=UPI00341BCA2A
MRDGWPPRFGIQMDLWAIESGWPACLCCSGVTGAMSAEPRGLRGGQPTPGPSPTPLEPTISTMPDEPTSPEWRAALIEELIRSFTDRGEFDRFVHGLLNHTSQLWLGTDPGLEAAVSTVVMRIAQDGRPGLERLADAAARERPRNARLAGLAASSRRRRVDSAVPALHQIPNTAFFDLDAQKRVIEDAFTDSGLIGFGLRHPDEVHERKLSEYLQCYAAFQRREMLTLSPVAGRIEWVVGQLTRYSRHSARYVIFPIRVTDVGVDVLAGLWHGAQRLFSRDERCVVLQLLGDEDTVFPPGVVEVPKPVFAARDVSIWVRQALVQLAWSHELAAAWTDLILDNARVGDEIDVRGVYEGLDETSNLVRHDPDEFLRLLKERYRDGATRS